MVWDVELHKRFKARDHAFDLNVRFQSSARRLALFGPSGAGKSLTLKMMAGLFRPDAGHVRLDGSTLYDHRARVDLSPQRRGLAYVFQDYALFPHLTVVQNIAFGLRSGLANPGRKIQSPAVERWLAAFHLESVANRYPEQLSGGQRQRTALARALVAEPRALLLDEPFAALDRPLRRHLRRELLDLQVELGIPLVLITHDEEDVESLADEVIAIYDGRAGEAVRPVAPEGSGWAREVRATMEAVESLTSESYVESATPIPRPHSS